MNVHTRARCSPESMQLTHRCRLTFRPAAPFHFDATLHKPSHFPSSDSAWVPGTYWITMQWGGEALGLKLEHRGSIARPEVRIIVYSKRRLSKEFLDGLRPELDWRFNFSSDLSEFTRRFRRDRMLGPIIRRWRGMRPVAANSLYETLVIYVVLQNATVRRSVQMLEALFHRYGTQLEYDGRTLSCFWRPKQLAGVTEEALRELRVGYRAKFLKRISEQFADGEIDEFSLRGRSNVEIVREVLKLYGIGPASVEYLLFDNFYRYNAFATVPPWEQKILSRLLFRRKLVPVVRILQYANRWGEYRKLAIHYIWEGVFWKRKSQRIPWLEEEIRL